MSIIHEYRESTTSKTENTQYNTKLLGSKGIVNKMYRQYNLQINWLDFDSFIKMLFTALTAATHTHNFRNKCDGSSLQWMGVQETHTSSSRFRCADCFIEPKNAKNKTSQKASEFVETSSTE